MTRVIGFHYTLRDEDGDVLDSSEGAEPLFYIEGQQQIIPGLERQLATLAVGDRRTIEVKAKDAYGELDPELVARVKRTQFPPDADLEIGERFMISDEEDAPIFTIVEVDDDEVTIDGNHPMAGKDLFFEIEMVGIRDATEEEIEHGHAHGPDGAEHHH